MASGVLGRFVRGNRGGPGRPRGSRNRLREEVLSDLYADWPEYGPGVIAAVRERSPAVCLRVVAGLVRHQVGITSMREDVGAMTDEELARALLHANETLAPAAARARLFGSGDAYGLTYAFCRASGSPLIAAIAADVGACVPRVRRAMRSMGYLGGRPRTGGLATIAQSFGLYVGVGRLVCRASCVASITCK